MVTMVTRAFEIMFDPQVKRHLQAVERKYHRLIRDTIREQLAYEPLTETKNRKPLFREIELEAEWELRFGPDNRFRVFYAVDFNQRNVQVLAIGVKKGDRLYIAGEEIKL